MGKRIAGLSELDPLAVPLPHGTEVTLRAERIVEGRKVPRGLTGRVVRARDGGLDILIVGVGEVWYARDEVTPRKAGQLEFAQRREEAWQALLPCVVLSATVGSRAWGLASPESDVDTRGAFILPHAWRGGLVVPPFDLVSADGSHIFWEGRKLVQQALRADPNTLELLFVPGAAPSDPMGQWILEARDAFTSKLMFGSFGRYALSQLDKLSAAQRLAQHRDRVLDWLQEEPAPSLDEVSIRLAALSPRTGRRPEDGVLLAKTYIKQLYRSLSDQGLLDANDFEAMKRYAREGGRRPPEARELRPKNAYNLLRLIELATGWLRDGVPRFATTGAFRERLLAIKEGQVPLDEVLREAESLSPALEEAHRASRLPEQPDYRRADTLLQQLWHEAARRHVLQLPGPLGADAPAPPTAASSEESDRDEPDA